MYNVHFSIDQLIEFIASVNDWKKGDVGKKVCYPVYPFPSIKTPTLYQFYILPINSTTIYNVQPIDKPIEFIRCVNDWEKGSVFMSLIAGLLSRKKRTSF